jgi:hypothetical protein
MYGSACAWERSIKRLAWTVLGAVIVIGLVGLYDAGVASIVPLAKAITSSESRWLWFVVDAERSRIVTWLLLAAPPLAQGAFLGLVVFRLVWPVPPLETPHARTGRGDTAVGAGEPTPDRHLFRERDADGRHGGMDRFTWRSSTVRSDPARPGPQSTDVRGPPLAAHAPGRVGAHGHGGGQSGAGSDQVAGRCPASRHR